MRFTFRKTLDPNDRIIDINTLEELTEFIQDYGGRIVIHYGTPSRPGLVMGLQLVLIYIKRAFYLIRRGIFLRRVEDRLRWGGLDELFEIHLCEKAVS